MSLLLDALKKAAEKNVAREQPIENDVDHSALLDNPRDSIETPAVSQSSDNIMTLDAASEQKEVVPSLEESLERARLEANSDFDSLIEEDLEFADLLSDDTGAAQSNEKELSIEDVEFNRSSALLDDEELALVSNEEESLLTDDDVTSFLGNEEPLQFDGSLLNFDDDETVVQGSYLNADDSIDAELKLDDPSEELHLSDNDATYQAEPAASITTNAVGESKLNSLTNDVRIVGGDQTSTETFASDNYDRTLVKLDSDTSKVFTGMKSVELGEAMTPDFAKKVFVHKSTSLRKRNYKIYSLISLFLFVAIAVVALFEMQSQLDDIETSLVSLQRNPVPAKLRIQRKESEQENRAILEGRIDTEALTLLKSIREKTNDVTDSRSKLASVVAENARPTTEQLEEKSSVGSPEVLDPKKSIEKKKAKVKPDSALDIKIETKVSESKESIWLKKAYAAFERGDLELSMMTYAKILEKNPTNRDALLGQAAILTGQNKTQQAIDNYQTILLANPKDSLALTSLITASTMSPVESESRLKLLLRDSPNATFLQFALGNVISAQNRWKEAQQYYFTAYQSQPNNPDYAYNLAVSLEQINKPDISIKYYEQAVKNSQTIPASFDVAIIKQRIEVLSQ